MTEPQTADLVPTVSFQGLRDQVLAHGLCVGTHTDDWFPISAVDSAEADQHAERQCAGCPVRTECLELALLGGEDFGIWGGTTPARRRRMRRNRARRSAAKLRGAA
jgi:WhiB family redox-sensing transcriptional regulator